MTSDEGSTVSLTRDISPSGLFFFVSSPPAVGTVLRLTLHPEGQEPLELVGAVRYRIPDVGAGVAVEGGGDRDAYRRLVDELATNGRLWSALRSLLDDTDGMFDQKELVPIGDRCEALDILFEKSPMVDASALTVQGKTSLSGVSEKPIGLRLHERDRLRSLRVGRTTGGRYVALIPDLRGENQYTCYALQGLEQIVIRSGGRPVDPYIDPEELNRRKARARNNVKRTPTDELPRMPLFVKWTRFDDEAAEALGRIFEQFESETRTYQKKGPRSVRIWRRIVLNVRNDRGESDGPATLVHDGKRYCVLFGLHSDASMEVRPLTEADELRIVGFARPRERS